MSGYDVRDPDRSDDARPGGGAIAPGKRTLTQSLPPSLAGRQRAVASFDEVDTISDTRATIEDPAAAGGAPRLTARQLRRARAANPRWHERLHFDPGTFGGAALDSADFAHGVAERQAQVGVAVDGVAGPKTVAATGASAARDAAFEATRGRRDAAGAAARATPGGMDAVDDVSDTRATIAGRPSDALMDPFADDDPFGMHLIGS